VFFLVIELQKGMYLGHLFWKIGVIQQLITTQLWSKLQSTQ